MTNNPNLKRGWKPGQSGNPAGRPKGSRNRTTLVALAAMEQGAEEIARMLVEAALGGDISAARFVLDRLCPPMRDRPISIDLPDTRSAEGISKAQQAVLEAVAGGELTPGEGAALAGLVEGRRKALETEELERRIATLEEKSWAC
ncbi:MAG: hypothetical protein H6R10_1463 [Rhodocyclaceae bacterium]|nr:hypothetical protein [Rhodocyclaceae bacterium]